MPWPVAESPQRFGGPEGVEQFGRFAPVFFFGVVARYARHALQERLKRIARRDRGSLLRWGGRRAIRPRFVVLLLYDVREHEPIPVPRNGADESRLTRVFVERAAKRTNRLAEGAV